LLPARRWRRQVVSLAEAAAQAIQIAPRDQQEIEQASALSNLAA